MLTLVQLRLFAGRLVGRDPDRCYIVAREVNAPDLATLTDVVPVLLKRDLK